MRPGKRRLLNPFIEAEFAAERVMKSGFMKVRYRRLDEEHGADRQAVRVVESLDGAAEVDGGQGMSAAARAQCGSPGPAQGPRREANRMG